MGNIASRRLIWEEDVVEVVDDDMCDCNILAGSCCCIKRVMKLLKFVKKHVKTHAFVWHHDDWHARHGCCDEIRCVDWNDCRREKLNIWGYKPGNLDVLHNWWYEKSCLLDAIVNTPCKPIDANNNGIWECKKCVELHAVERVL